MSGMLPIQPDRASLYGSIIVSCVTLLIFMVALAIAWWTKDASLPILVGVAATNASTAISFWLGSSSGSQKKDGVIAQQAASAVPVPVALSSTTMGTTR